MHIFIWEQPRIPTSPSGRILVVLASSVASARDIVMWHIETLREGVELLDKERDAYLAENPSPFERDPEFLRDITSRYSSLYAEHGSVPPELVLDFMSAQPTRIMDLNTEDIVTFRGNCGERSEITAYASIVKATT